MKKIYTLKLLLTLCIFWAPWLLLGQDIQTLPAHLLSKDYQVKGLYQIQADNGTGTYLKEQKEVLTLEKMVITDESFYFWIVENVKNSTFQIYSAKHRGKLVAIDAEGTAIMVTDPTLKETELVFRIPGTGPKREKSDTNTAAIGYISTLEVSDYMLPDCQCNKIKHSNGRFSVLKTTIDKEPILVSPNATLTNSVETANTAKAIDNTPLALRIYPNPASNIVNFTFNAQGKETATMRLYNLDGKQLVTATYTNNGKEALQGQANIEHLPAGIYILKIQLQNGESFMKKVIKK